LEAGISTIATPPKLDKAVREAISKTIPLFNFGQARADPAIAKKFLFQVKFAIHQLGYL
jgi:hypothetical protein